MRLPSGENDAELTVSSYVATRSDGVRVLSPTSHIRIVPSGEPETRRVPSGEIDTDQTVAVCTRSGPDSSLPLVPSHRQTAQSAPPEAMYLPSAENVTEKIAWIAWSALAAAMREPSGENVTE
ncbi:hypothetical protein BN14_12262 [Rhizoctonia solani AG-1 IB]|uniref:Uncharacterized protein n=1 Tax=Thanatephorus cucumeris (strain AG1-IB / isolate 7/3/14) TaxID=1108050 RepID=M5CHL9_THACB|nr:hypothetical protein BN14_12262 [Rhizoctonia solani AG-1 IB]